MMVDQRGSSSGRARERFARKLRAFLRLRSDQRGALMVEYVVLVGGIALGGSLGLILIGAAVARNFEFVRSILLCPIP